MPRHANVLTWFALFFLTISSAAIGYTEDEIGVTVPQGFTVTKFSDDALAHDIFSMAIDSQGRVVVSGAGYIRILIDSDGDGKADTTKQFADGPATGAQGMCFFGRDLLCTGDGGLIRYRDADGDDVADGPPDTFLKMETGGEHNAHAIRRGPDGWWYLITGNTSLITSGYATLPTSPVKEPMGGAVLRLKPDLSGGEVFAHGFRNAYDFDFDAHGELYVYDSDSERDVSLPWYLPTRLFQVLPSAHHGWVTDSWLIPDYFLDAAPVAASTGRGSPTGVACYRHNQFPEEYRGSMFILDWTFGRVFNVPLTKHGATFVGMPQEFMTHRGEFGFAPTDIEVGKDGSLYVCVGGRGTHGTVYKVTYTVNEKTSSEAAPFPTLTDGSTTDQRVAACLNALQPNSSWSRTQWVPMAKALGADNFLAAAFDERLTAGQRVRAIEILTEIFSGIPAESGTALTKVRSPEVRARVAWSLGVKPVPALAPEVMIALLGDTDALVRRRALEAIPTAGVNPYPLVAALAQRMNDDQRSVRIAAAKLVPDLDTSSFKAVSDSARRLGWQAALTNTLGFIRRTQANGGTVNTYALDIGRRILEGEHSRDLKLEAVRVMQIALGDLGPGETTLSPVFDGYRSPLDLSKFERDLDPLRITLSKQFPTGDRLLDIELSRLTAMIMPLNNPLLDKVVSQITDKSNPVDDIHYLAVAGRIPVPRSKKQQAAIARALVRVDAKLKLNHLSQDQNWNERVGEIYSRLVELDEDLPVKLIAQPDFGRPGHVLFLSRLPEKHLSEAQRAFATAVASDTDYPWNNDMVFVFGMGQKTEYLSLIRRQFDKYELRMAVLMVLASSPEDRDREKFVAGLDLPAVDVLTTCVDALEKLPTKRDGAELVSLVKLLRRLGTDESEFPLRERVVKLLQRDGKVKEDHHFVFGPEGYGPQPEAIESWTTWASQEFPSESSKILGSADADFSTLKASLATINWTRGSEDRGRKLFTARGCAQCHAGGSGLGPDLAGCAGRFSREDLFAAIALPNRDVSPRYQTLLVETKSGKVFTGLVVYESVEGLLLRNGTNQTFRIEAGDIESKRYLPNSLMPSGLLKDLGSEELADLYAYLKSLTVRTADTGGGKE